MAEDVEKVTPTEEQGGEDIANAIDTSADGNNAEQPTEKTYSQKEVDEMLKGMFTQEQMNEVIEKRLARVKNVPQNSNEYENVKSQLQDLQLKLAGYEKEVALSKYKIGEEYQDYIDYKVLHMTGKDKSYAQALEEFFSKEENKKYLINDNQIQNKPNIPRPKNSNSLVNEKAVDNNLRAMFGLAKK